MAGSFGFEADKYDVSMAIGELELLPAVRKAPPDWLIIADGFSCREQIAQGTGRHALHLAEVLQMALHRAWLGQLTARSLPRIRHGPPAGAEIQRFDEARLACGLGAARRGAGVAVMAHSYQKTLIDSTDLNAKLIAPER